MPYAALYDLAVNRDSRQFMAPFNHIANEARVFAHEDGEVQEQRRFRKRPRERSMKRRVAVTGRVLQRLRQDRAGHVQLQAMITNIVPENLENLLDSADEAEREHGK